MVRMAALLVALAGCAAASNAPEDERVAPVISGPYRTPIQVAECDDDDDSSATSVCLAIASVRALAGLQPLRRDDAASRAARGHCNYVSLNRSFTHTQDPRKPGFTGITFRDRLAAARFTDDPGGEVLASIVGGAAITGASGFLNSVYHRAMFLRSETTSYGYGVAGQCATIDLGRPHRFESVPVVRVVWPPDGARDVPTTFHADGELPNPVPGRAVVGSPISVIGAAGAIAIALASPTGAVRGVTITSTNDPNKLVRPGEAHFVPDLPLTARTRYRVTVSVGNETLVSTFLTAL